MTRRTVSLLALFALLVAMLAACGSGAPSSAPSYPADAVRISADGLHFSTAELVVPSGRAFTLVFQNKEGVPHNVVITTEPGGKGTILFRHDPITATTKDFTVPAIQAGTWYFHCDVHPSMTGTVIAR